MLDIKVGAALLGFTLVEQRTILDCVKEGKEAPTSRLQEAVAKVTEIIDTHEEVVEGYAGFPIDKSVIDKNKNTFKDDRNIGRVISQGGQSMVITGKKADGRYQVVGKKGEKTAKAPEDIGLNMQREHIDIDDLHQQMVEGLKQARKNVGASTCWDGYKAKGTKKKGGKEVPNCVKEEDQIDELYKGKHGQSEKEYQDGRSDGGKMVSGDSKHSGAAYSSRAVKNTGPNPAGGSKKPKAQGRMTSGARADLAYRKANLKKEDFEAFVEEIILDEEFDTFSFEELHDICVEALMELDGEVLTEALEVIDELDLLTERMDPKEVQRRRDQAKDRLATGAAMKKAAASSSDKPAAAPSRREKMKAALKSAGKAVAKGAGRAVGTAVRAAKSAGSEFKKGYERGSSGSSSKPAPGGSSVSSSQSPSSSGGSSSGGEGRTRLRDKIKSGIKKVVGGAARAVSRGARNVARRMSEQPTYNWRAELGINDEA
tara:strand:+ start:1080 stop:2534 length:1455 start_codon:yes stop_codon:yes gene_type:complete